MRKTIDIQSPQDGLEVVRELGDMVSSANLQQCYVRVTIQCVRYKEKDQEVSIKERPSLRIAE